MPANNNHRPGSPLYVSPSVRICGECGAHKSIEQFSQVNSVTYRTVCRACEREQEGDASVRRAANAMAKAATAMSRPQFVMADDAPALRKSLKGTLGYLHQTCAEDFEVDGAQVFGRMFGEFLSRIFSSPDSSDFLKLKGFTALQKQMDGLLRHDQQKVDLSKIPTDELSRMVGPVMSQWFRENPEQLVALVADLPDDLKTLVAQATVIETEVMPPPIGIEEGGQGDGV